MRVQEMHIDRINATSYYKIFFEDTIHRQLTLEEYIEASDALNEILTNILIRDKQPENKNQ